MPLRTGFDIQRFNAFGKDYLPGLVGVLFTGGIGGPGEGELALRRELLAPNGYPARRHYRHLRRHPVRLWLHLAPAGERREFPPRSELKSNFLNTAREGTLYGEARAVHLGRSTQIWDAVVSHGEERRKLALFRCTQMVLYPK